MGKNIIIAEKPSVGREYARVLGVAGDEKNGYIENERWIVTWTVGHLITMSYPEKYNPDLKEWKLETIPFIPDNYKYETIKETSRQFSIVKKLYNRHDIDAIYYAGDSGREGLYIQMLVRQFAGHNPNAAERVVWIDSQTEEEILRGIAEAKDLKEYKSMADAGYMRAIEDYVTGINFSRLLSVKYSVMLNSGSGQKKHKPISVGRVMTCVLGMIVNREREIRNFRTTYFYRVAALLNINGWKIECEWRETDKSKYYKSPQLYSEFGFLKENDAKEMIQELEANLTIDNVSKTVERKNAPLFYNLAELQGECAKQLHISPAETLKIAQSLYEKKLTTYPRTDARVITNAIAKEIDKNLKGLLKGIYAKYVVDINKNNWMIKGKYVDDSKVTDHYAIIPTGNVPQNLTEREAAVYDMICRRFLAAFYPPAEYERIKIESSSSMEKFYGTSKYLVTPGYYNVTGFPEEDSNSKETVEAMSKLNQGKTYPVAYETRKGETTPPKHYTTGSIVLAMENAGTLIENDELREQIKSNGIGTSATRAEVIEKLIRLNYISVNDKKQIITPTNFGEMVFEIVNMTVPSMLSPEMTAKWEKGLAQIATGELSKQKYENELYDYIRSECRKIKKMNNNDEIIRKIYPLATGRIQSEYKEFDSYNTKIRCPLCGDEVETTRWGFKCKSNISKTEGCTFVMGGDILGHRLLTNELASLFHNGKSGPYYDFISQKGKPFGAYLVWNDSDKQIGFELVDMPWEESELTCPICNKKILKRDSFYKCRDYIDAQHGCSFHIGKILGKTIPEKQVEKLLKDGKTDLIKGFKKESGDKFDAFLVWSGTEKKICFQFPEQSDLETKYRCPNCNGKILSTSYGFKCENYKPQKTRKDGECMFFAGTILGHTIKEKELQCIVEKRLTDLVMFKTEDKKTFEARLYWDMGEHKISMKFDDNTPTETSIDCPICGSRLMKNKFGFYCSRHISKDEGCKFVVGNIAGVVMDEKQLRKLVSEGKTELISGFKPKEKGKKPFSAYLLWKKEENKIAFEFPEANALKEESNYFCPVCHQRKLMKSQYNYSCECGFKLNFVIAGKTLPDEQVKKLLLRGETDVISGFFSPRTRKMFSAKLMFRGNKIDFSFPETKA